jgi:CopG family nickel-responsive transcriptional regulator
VAELDRIVQHDGYHSRSEAIRSLIRQHLSELRTQARTEGPVMGAIAILADKVTSQERVRALQHRFEDIIKLHLHTHLEKTNCLEVVVVRGENTRLGRLVAELRAVPGVAHVRLLPVG